jgi:hypothetical protein
MNTERRHANVLLFFKSPSWQKKGRACVFFNQKKREHFRVRLVDTANTRPARPRARSQPIPGASNWVSVSCLSKRSVGIEKLGQSGPQHGSLGPWGQPQGIVRAVGGRRRTAALPSAELLQPHMHVLDKTRQVYQQQKNIFRLPVSCLCALRA